MSNLYPQPTSTQLCSLWDSDASFHEVTEAPRFLPDNSTSADTVPSEYVSITSNSGSGAASSDNFAPRDNTSWLPPGMISPGMIFDGDDDVLSVILSERKEEVESAALPVRSQDDEMFHGLDIAFSDTTLSVKNAYQQDHFGAHRATETYPSIVSPHSKPKVTRFNDMPFEPRSLRVDMAMVVGEPTALKQRGKTCLRGSGKDTLWMQNYRALQEFKAEHGHTNVPQDWKNNPSLGNWVKYNRQKMRDWKNGSDEDLDKMMLLNDIGLKCYIGKGNAARVNGVQFSAHQIRAWEKQYMNLCKYKEEHGNCNVPTNERGKWKSLGEWVKRQRKVYRKFRSTGGVEGNSYHLIERFQKLERIGFAFHIGSGRWRGN